MFYTRSSTKLNSFDLRAGIALKMHQKTASLMLEIPHPTHDDEYAAIILMARQLLPTPTASVDNHSIRQAPASFSMDSGAIAPLYFVAAKCGNRSLRQEALTLLNSSRRLEGIWDGALVAKVARRYLQLKEAGTRMEKGVLELAERFEFKVEEL